MERGEDGAPSDVADAGRDFDPAAARCHPDKIAFPDSEPVGVVRGPSSTQADGAARVKGRDRPVLVRVWKW